MLFTLVEIDPLSGIDFGRIKLATAEWVWHCQTSCAKRDRPRALLTRRQSKEFEGPLPEEFRREAMLFTLVEIDPPSGIDFGRIKLATAEWVWHCQRCCSHFVRY